MLVDLEFSVKYREQNTSTFEVFDTSNGGLRVIFNSPSGEKIDHECAIKDPDHVGVYGGWNFDHIINDYSNYNIICDWKISQDACAKMMQALSQEEKEKYRSIWIEKCQATYGLADNLEQIFVWGKKFIDSFDPYVIAVMYLDADCFEKNGEYIGTQNLWEKEEALFFEFFHLEKKNNVSCQ